MTWQGLILGGAIAVAGSGFGALAQEAETSPTWRNLQEMEILQALTGRTLEYETGAWQRFNASGRTLYHAGRDSWGYWAVRDHRYCSMWPPSDLWVCYDIQAAPGAIRFVDAGGGITSGSYQD